MPPTSSDTRPLHLTIKTNAGSCEHFYHFLLGYLLPLAAYIARRGIAEDRALILRDCGPLNGILRELALPGLLCCERFTHASIRKSLEHSPWAKTDEIDGFDFGHVPGEEISYDAASIGIGVQFLRRRLASAIETAMIEINSSWPGSPRVLLIERGEADPFYQSSLVELKSAASQRRSIGNHSEVAARLAADYPGFRSVRLETASLAEQVAWFGLTDILVAQHGAALSNIIWMRRGAHVVEIDPDRWPGRRERICGSAHRFFNPHDGTGRDSGADRFGRDAPSSAARPRCRHRPVECDGTPGSATADSCPFAGKLGHGGLGSGRVR